MQDPATLTPEILAMLDKHEPDKSKQAKLLTEHLTRQRVLPSTEEEPQQHLERKAKREHERQLEAAEAEANIQEQERQAETARLAQNARVVATFAKRARDAAISAGATPEAAEAAAVATTTDVETTIADAIAMQG
jgi:hypothetical protein